MSNGGGVFAISYQITGHLVSLLALTAIFAGLCFYYSKTICKCRSYDKMPKLTFLMFVAVQWIRRNTYQIVGKSYSKVVPFFIYIMAFFWFSNIISILGFPTLGDSLAIPASLALVVFVGTVLSGLIYRGFGYFGDYVVWIKWKGNKIFPVVDPLKMLGELSKVLSMSLRLWGNTLAGSLILFIIYNFADTMFDNANIEYLGPVLFPLFVLPLHIYFDIIGGTIQPMIFMLLTMCYWALARHGEGAAEKNHDVQPEEVVV